MYSSAASHSHSSSAGPACLDCLASSLLSSSAAQVLPLLATTRDVLINNKTGWSVNLFSTGHHLYQT